MKDDLWASKLFQVFKWYSEELRKFKHCLGKNIEKTLKGEKREEIFTTKKIFGNIIL